MTLMSLDDLPPDASQDRAGFERLGLRSAALASMVVEGQLVGVLGFGSGHAEPRWSPELTQRLQLFAQVMAGALARRQSELALRAVLSDNERLRDRLAAENVYLQEAVKEAHCLGDIVGRSPALQAALTRVEQVAATDAPVLLLGETGTGKEGLARLIHAR